MFLSVLKMPYYCTVPRCTSMAGKAKNVSFHQFPRDEELASLWNKILKRGKPYTKYSKVCSLHFRPEDYTITSVGKNKGQWRTLRKDAIPSQNLPQESPGPSRVSGGGYWMPNLPNNVPDPQVLSMQQQVAQAIYLQTMLASQAVANGTPHLPTQSANLHIPTHLNDVEMQENLRAHNSSYQCQECSKCFKDPDVFMLHRRTHKQSEERSSNSILGKENLNSNGDVTNEDTLKANPILANLLKNGMSSDLSPNLSNVLDASNVLSIENQIMAALAVTMESYIRNLSILQGFSPAAKEKDCDEIISNDNSEMITNDNSRENGISDDECSTEENLVEEHKIHDSRLNSDEKNDNLRFNGDSESYNDYDPTNDTKCEENGDLSNDIDQKHWNCNENYDNHDDNDQRRKHGQNGDENYEDNHDESGNDSLMNNTLNDTTQDSENESSCDKQDLNESKDSDNLVIDEDA